MKSVTFLFLLVLSSNTSVAALLELVNSKGQRIESIFSQANRLSPEQWKAVLQQEKKRIEAKACLQIQSTVGREPSIGNPTTTIGRFVQKLQAIFGLSQSVKAYSCPVTSCSACAGVGWVYSSGVDCGANCGGGTTGDTQLSGDGPLGTCFGARACPGPDCCSTTSETCSGNGDS